MTSINRIHHASAHAAHKPSAAAREILGAAKGTLPSCILDNKLANVVQHMRPSESVVETHKGGTAKLVYHFKSAAEAKAVYDSATELDKKTGTRYLTPSFGDNIAEQLDRADEVGDPTAKLNGANLVIEVKFKPVNG